MGQVEPPQRRALITGCTGQDGSYLAEQLAADNWDVYGMVHGQVSPKWAWAQGLVPSMTLVQGDLLDQSSLQYVLSACRPHAVFNLAALSFVGTSWTQPNITSEVTGLGVLRMLDAIRFVNPKIRFVQASSSEMFGQSQDFPQDESTPLNPCSPYAVAKAFAHHTVLNYRQSYAMHASTAVMFNHESPRRGKEFVTRKVTQAVAQIAAGLREDLALGRLDPCRDWGWAPDYMRALPLIVSQEEPGDYVLATGESHSVWEWCTEAFGQAGMDAAHYVQEDVRLYRPAEVEKLQGDASRALEVLGWKPSMRFTDIVKAMVDADRKVAP